MHRGGIDAGAEAYHQHGRARMGRAGDDGAQVGGGDMAQCVALCLQVVEDGDATRAGGGGQLCAVHDPIEIGHGGGAVLHRARGGDADTIGAGPGGGKVVAQDMGDVLTACLVFGVGEARDAAFAHGGAIGQGDPCICAADISEKGEGHGGLSGQSFRANARARA
jgi:hypothetical protein